ncbi:MAG TPA: hypothetical protein VFK29_09795 [Rhodanobacteraceae bacterium]|nr:hypothetical protein [Rhodanobacteraceae bacterium]
MHDGPDYHPMNDNDDDASLAAALRALPAPRPERDAWPALAARIRHRRRTRRAVWFTLPPAFAACLALALLWPHGTAHAPTPVQLAQPAGAATRPTADADLAALQASSRQWQTWVQHLDADGAPLNGRALAQAVALQDRIGMIDLQLSAARDPATLTDLWQHRITLLQRLGLLHLQPYEVAEQGRSHVTRTTIL